MTTQQAVIVAIVVGAVIALARFELFCVRDLAATRDADLQYLTRAGWFTCILLAIPLGGILYLCRGKTR